MQLVIQIQASAILLFSVALGACSGEQNSPNSTSVTPLQTASAAPSPKVEPPPKQVSAEQWRGIFESTHARSIAQPDEDGITKFRACFVGGSGPNCKAPFTGRFDGFRNVTHLRPMYSYLHEVTAPSAYVGMYLTIIECKQPILIFEPVVNLDGWLFMNKISVMVNGAVLVEQDLAREDVERDTVPGGIRERGFWKLEPDSINALRTISSSGKSIIRLTGEKGFVTLKKDQELDFRRDLREILIAIDKMQAAFAAAGGFECLAPQPPRESTAR